MKAERRVVDGSNQFALRATESQELFYAEFPNAAQVSATSVNWGYKIPWKQHAISVHINEAVQEKVTAYSYKIDDNNKTDVSFNHKNNSVSAGFVVNF
jgi:late competence protein required for DNA uptake (superfamily II DNA/RNA helicase)